MHPVQPTGPYKERPSDETRVQKISQVVLSFLAKLPNLLDFSGVVAIQVGNAHPVILAFNPIGEAFDEEREFNCFSIGKLFTAISIMQLIVEQKIRELGQPISELLKEEDYDLHLDPPYDEDKPSKEFLAKFKSMADKITVRDLLNHTSGLRQMQTPREEFHLIESEEKKRLYSNYGYQLLARIIGRTTPYSSSSDPDAAFKEHIEKRIFFLADMQEALQAARRSKPIPELKAYVVDEGKFKEVKRTEPYPHGNGCWRMKASELLAFQRALLQGKLLDPVLFKSMMDEDPALGFDVEKKNGTIVGYGHPGAADGGTSFLYTYLQFGEPVTCAVLSNCSTGQKIKGLLEYELYKLG